MIEKAWRYFADTPLRDLPFPLKILHITVLMFALLWFALAAAIKAVCDFIVETYLLMFYLLGLYRPPEK